MKKIFLFLLCSILLPSQTWVGINSNAPKPMNIEMIESNIENTKIMFSMEGFHLVPTNDSKKFIVKTENGASLLNKGYPDLQKDFKVCYNPRCISYES